MNIFVANLNFKLEDHKLKEIFEEYGEVSSARIIKDKLSGRSKGFGFVEFVNDEDAENAIKSLDQMEVDGRNIVVKKANPKTASPA